MIYGFELGNEIYPLFSHEDPVFQTLVYEHPEVFTIAHSWKADGINFVDFEKLVSLLSSYFQLRHTEILSADIIFFIKQVLEFESLSTGNGS